MKNTTIRKVIIRISDTFHETAVYYKSGKYKLIYGTTNLPKTVQDYMCVTPFKTERIKEYNKTVDYFIFQ